MRLITNAPGKVNLCLFLGPTRPDGLHQLVSVIEPVALADTITLTSLADAAGTSDRVVCPGVHGDNLAATALAAYRDASGWDGPPCELVIEKRVPIVGGMGGGSADAAAALRLIATYAGQPADPLLVELAPQLGSDVPSQIKPGLVLATGSGADVFPQPSLQEHAFVVIPASVPLSTPVVYAAADQLGLARPAAELAQLRAEVAAALRTGTIPLELIHNDLEPAAIHLHPPIEQVLQQLRVVGADKAFVSGSGPTTVGYFIGPKAMQRAEKASRALQVEYPQALMTEVAHPSITTIHQQKRASSQGR